MTQTTTVHSEWRSLKADTEMSTGYRGRGLQPLTKTFPAGTRVHYTRTFYHGDFVAHDGDPVETIHHKVSVRDESGTYSAARWELGPDAPNPHWIADPAERRAHLRAAIENQSAPCDGGPSPEDVR